MPLPSNTRVPSNTSLQGLPSSLITAIELCLHEEDKKHLSWTTRGFRDFFNRGERLRKILSPYLASTQKNSVRAMLNGDWDLLFGNMQASEAKSEEALDNLSLEETGALPDDILQELIDSKTAHEFERELAFLETMVSSELETYLYAIQALHNATRRHGFGICPFIDKEYADLFEYYDKALTFVHQKGKLSRAAYLDLFTSPGLLHWCLNESDTMTESYLLKVKDFFDSGELSGLKFKELLTSPYGGYETPFHLVIEKSEDTFALYSEWVKFLCEEGFISDEEIEILLTNPDHLECTPLLRMITRVDEEKVSKLKICFQTFARLPDKGPALLQKLKGSLQFTPFVLKALEYSDQYLSCLREMHEQELIFELEGQDLLKPLYHLYDEESAFVKADSFSFKTYYIMIGTLYKENLLLGEETGQLLRSLESWEKREDQGSILSRINFHVLMKILNRVQQGLPCDKGFHEDHFSLIRRLLETENSKGFNPLHQVLTREKKEDWQGSFNFLLKLVASNIISKEAFQLMLTQPDPVDGLTPVQRVIGCGCFKAIEGFAFEFSAYFEEKEQMEFRQLFIGPKPAWIPTLSHTILMQKTTKDAYFCLLQFLVEKLQVISDEECHTLLTEADSQGLTPFHYVVNSGCLKNIDYFIRELKRNIPLEEVLTLLESVEKSPGDDLFNDYFSQEKRTIETILTGGHESEVEDFEAEVSYRGI